MVSQALRDEFDVLRATFCEEITFANDPDDEVREGDDVSNELYVKLKIPSQHYDAASGSACEVGVDLTIQLPSTYPKLQRPDVLIRTSSTQHDAHRLNEECREYIAELPLDSPMVYDIVAWVQEHFHEYRNEEVTIKSAKPKKDRYDPPMRWFIYSHHIYSNTKRKNIVQLTSDLNLGGFCLSGKPGVICIEGGQSACESFWETIRRWNWQKLQVRHKESSASAPTFDRFAELSTEDVDQRTSHSFDMGDFRRYLSEHKLEHVFPIIFGVGD